MTNPPKSNLPERYRKFSELYAELETEIKDLIATAGPDISMVSRSQRRLIVRSTFAFIEAVVFSIKAIAAQNEVGGPVSTADKLIAAEATYELSEKGELIVRPMKLRLAPNVRYAFRLFKNCYEVPTDLDVTGEGWQSFLRSIKVRDRITHPKGIDDISISDEELMDVAESLSWFRENVSGLMEEGVRSMHSRIKSLSGELVRLRTEIGRRISGSGAVTENGG